MTSSDSIELSKAALREEMLRRCASVTSEEASEAGSAMADILSASPDWLEARRVGLFAGLPGEPDTRPLFSMLRGMGKEVFLPRCLADGGLEMAGVADWSALRPGRFGIPEPPDGAPCQPLSMLDLILVPGVAFDPFGGRLGRGGGFYDRAVAAGDGGGRRLGVGFAFQLVERVPVREHDRGVAGLLTERSLAPVVESDP